MIITFGALAGGFVSGLAGFGTALMTMGIWLHALEPATAATLTLICSVVAQAQTIPTILRTVVPGRVLPFVIPGLAGVPIGLIALGSIDAGQFKFGAGAFLVVFACCMLLWRGRPAVTWGGRLADAVLGFFGGVLGGMAGLSGALPTLWASLRGWGKEEKRGVFQVFNLSILAAALLGHVFSGRVTPALLLPLALALPGTVLGAWMGFHAYRRLNERKFDDLIMGLLLLSGATLLFSVR